jgi:hypothetical protein
MPKSLKQKIKRLIKISKKVKNEATALYERWTDAELKGTIHSIGSLKKKLDTTWDQGDKTKAKEIEETLKTVRHKAIQALVNYKHKQEDEHNKKLHPDFSEKDVKVMHLDFPEHNDNEGREDWCRYARMAAFAIQKFHCRVMRRNPKPKHGANPNDTRDKYRSEEEEAWMEMQDKLDRIRKKIAYLEKVEDQVKANPSSNAHKHTKQNPRKGPRKQHPSGAKPIPAFPERKVSQGITPYQRPQVASRLPAFPKFPAYARK